MPSLDIDLLRTFVLIAEGLNFTRAAERIGRTQSAVSLQVKRLESLVGHRLFERSKGGEVQLTAQGQVFLEQARELTALNDRIVATVSAGGSGVRPDEANGRWPAGRPSIAVLPFVDDSGDQQEQYFANGMTVEIINALSRIKWLAVVAGRTAAVPAGRRTDPRRTGNLLGVRYLLMGTARRQAGRIRVFAQLVRAETAAVLWAEEYDGSLDDVFAFQDTIAEQVAGVVEPRLRHSEIERARRQAPQNLTAYDLYLRALPFVGAQMPAPAKKALPLLKQARRLDPDYVAVAALTAWCHELVFARDGFHESDRSIALQCAEETLASDTDDGNSLAIAGFVISLLTSQHDLALHSIERALDVNPSCSTALFLGAQAAGLAGRPLMAMNFANRGLYLSRLDPLAFEAHLALGEAALVDERYDDAVACFSRAAAAKPNFSTGYVFEAIALSLAGRADETGPVMRRALELEPDFRFRLFSELGLAETLVQTLASGWNRIATAEF